LGATKSFGVRAIHRCCLVQPAIDAVRELPALSHHVTFGAASIAATLISAIYLPHNGRTGMLATASLHYADHLQRLGKDEIDASK
jgi:hypothetical protein